MEIGLSQACPSFHHFDIGKQQRRKKAQSYYACVFMVSVMFAVCLWLYVHILLVTVKPHYN